MPAAARRYLCARLPASRSSSPASVRRRLDKLEAFHPDRVSPVSILGMGKTSSALVERAAETIQVEEAEEIPRGQDGQGQVRPRRPLGPAKPDAAHGRVVLAPLPVGMMPGLKGMKGAMDAGRRTARRCWSTWKRCSSSMTAKERTCQARDHQRQAQDPHRQGLRHECSGDQQAFEDAPGNGDSDEASEENGRASRKLAADVRQGAVASKGPSGRPLRPARRPSRGRSVAFRALEGAAQVDCPGLGGSAPFNLPPGFDKFSKK